MINHIPPAHHYIIVVDAMFLGLNQLNVNVKCYKIFCIYEDTYSYTKHIKVWYTHTMKKFYNLLFINLLFINLLFINLLFISIF
jgi:hypothetical protein